MLGSQKTTQITAADLQKKREEENRFVWDSQVKPANSYSFVHTQTGFTKSHMP